MYVERWKYVERAIQTTEPQEHEQDFNTKEVHLYWLGLEIVCTWAKNRTLCHAKLEMQMNFIQHYSCSAVDGKWSCCKAVSIM